MKYLATFLVVFGTIGLSSVPALAFGTCNISGGNCITESACAAIPGATAPYGISDCSQPAQGAIVCCIPPSNTGSVCKSLEDGASCVGRETCDTSKGYSNLGVSDCGGAGTAFVCCSPPAEKCQDPKRPGAACWNPDDCKKSNVVSAFGTFDCVGGQICCGPKESATTSAASTDSGSPTTLPNPLCGTDAKGNIKTCNFKDVDLISIINRAVNAFLGIAGSIAFLVFVYSGVMYMTAGGSDRIKKAVAGMKYAFLGLLIIFFAYIFTSLYLGVITTAPAPVEQVQTP